MNFFKKNKKSKKIPSSNLKTVGLALNDLPTQALEITYKQFMQDYESNPNQDTAQTLQNISTVLNQRAYDQGNGKLFQEIKAILPKITEEEFRNSNKENLKNYLKSKKQADEALKKLSEPEPQKIEFTMKVETPVTIKQDQTKPDTKIDVDLDNYENEYGSVDRPSPNEVIHQTNYDKKQDEEVVLINEVEVKKSPQPPKKKMTIPGMNFFKKKKMKTLIHLPKELDGDFVMKPKKEIGDAKTYSEEELQQALLQKEAQASVKLDHDPNMQTMSDPPKKQSIKTNLEGLQDQRLKGLFNKKPKLKLPNLVCPDCMHSIKAHTTKGESSGCKCGCLNTVETIIERHNVNLKEPKPQETQDEIVLKQAQKMASMKSLPKPVQLPTEISRIEPATKQRSLCANCDHIPKAHFDGTKFCTVIGCTCETYRAYPE